MHAYTCTVHATSGVGMCAHAYTQYRYPQCTGATVFQESILAMASPTIITLTPHKAGDSYPMPPHYPVNYPIISPVNYPIIYPVNLPSNLPSKSMHLLVITRPSFKRYVTL